MKRPLKIAMMVRSYIAMPRPIDMIYAPVDLALATAKELGKRGHDVTLFAPLGSVVNGENVRVETLNMRPLVNGADDFATLLANTEVLMHGIPGLWDRYMSNEIFKRATKGEFDLIHFHHPETALSTACQLPKIPVVYTLHDPIYSYYKEMFELFQSDNQHFISISNNQRRDAPDLSYAGTVYNGTDVEMFTFEEEKEDYLLYAGRIAPQKGVKEAIQVARDTDHRLLIIGPYADVDKGYFEQYIKPELDDRILYLGRIDQDRLPKYYQKAKALLTPVQWEEPFGLTTIEAMACGTPVISLNRGAAPEIIVDGKTGFVVSSVHDMVEAVSKLDTIKPSDCRDHVAKHFGITQMVDNYEKIFMDLVGVSPSKPSKKSGRTVKDKVPIKKSLGKIKRMLTS